MEGMYYGLGCIVFLIAFGLVAGYAELKKAQKN